MWVCGDLIGMCVEALEVVGRELVVGKDFEREGWEEGEVGCFVVVGREGGIGDLRVEGLVVEVG